MKRTGNIIGNTLAIAAILIPLFGILMGTLICLDILVLQDDTTDIVGWGMLITWMVVLGLCICCFWQQSTVIRRTAGIAAVIIIGFASVFVVGILIDSNSQQRAAVEYAAYQAEQAFYEDVESFSGVIDRSYNLMNRFSEIVGGSWVPTFRRVEEPEKLKDLMQEIKTCADELNIIAQDIFNKAFASQDETYLFMSDVLGERGKLLALAQLYGEHIVLDEIDEAYLHRLFLVRNEVMNTENALSRTLERARLKRK